MTNSTFLLYNNRALLPPPPSAFIPSLPPSSFSSIYYLQSLLTVHVLQLLSTAAITHYLTFSSNSSDPHITIDVVVLGPRSITTTVAQRAPTGNTIDYKSCVILVLDVHLARKGVVILTAQGTNSSNSC